MEYNQLQQPYRDDVLAEAIYGREVEYFHYAFDRDTYTEMLTNLVTDDPYRVEVQSRLDSTLAQMMRVECIHRTLLTRIADPTAHAAAVARCRAKRVVV